LLLKSKGIGKKRKGEGGLTLALRLARKKGRLRRRNSKSPCLRKKRKGKKGRRQT